MSESKRRDAPAAADTCCKALEVVATRGRLETPAWSVSQAVHAFAKQLPLLVVLADETPADTVQQLLLRPYKVAMQLEGGVIAPNPLPGTLKLLWEPLHSLLQRLPDGLDYLRLCKLGLDKAERLVLELQALPKLTVLRLEGIAMRTGLPPSLQELVLDRCTVSDELQLPVTLRKLRVLKCDSSSDYVDGELAVHFNEGLQQAIIVERQRSVDVGGALPSTLTHLVLRDKSASPLGPLPSGLLHLDLNRDLAEPLSMLPGALEVLQLGNRYEQPLDVLPDALTELKVGRMFNYNLGVLPASLKFLQVGNKFTQDLGPLPPQLKYLDIITLSQPQNTSIAWQLTHAALLRLLVACVYNNCFGSGDAKKFDHCLGDLPAALKTLHITERWEARHPLRN
eukprot:18083-Heterococcus_DN1.PRE.1